MITDYLFVIVRRPFNQQWTTTPALCCGLEILCIEKFVNIKLMYASQVVTQHRTRSPSAQDSRLPSPWLAHQIYSCISSHFWNKFPDVFRNPFFGYLVKRNLKKNMFAGHQIYLTSFPCWLTGFPIGLTSFSIGLTGFPIWLSGFPIRLTGFPISLTGFLVMLTSFLVCIRQSLVLKILLVLLEKTSSEALTNWKSVL